MESNFKSEDFESMLASYTRLLEKERDTAVRSQFQEFMQLHEKLRLCVESDFFHEVLTAKTSNRERELRKITTLLSDFIQKSADNSGSDEQFVQSLLAQSLRTAAGMVEMDRDEQGSINEAWVDALRLGYDIFLGSRKV